MADQAASGPEQVQALQRQLADAQAQLAAMQAAQNPAAAAAGAPIVTQGGAAVAGSVDVRSGHFIGRDFVQHITQVMQAGDDPAEVQSVIAHYLHTLAIDLAGGQERLAYRVPRQGRIRTYVFERAGEETIVLEAGSFRTQKLVRVDDEIDRSVIWSAPDLGYLAVRISKERAWNVDTDVRLRKLERPARPQH